MGLTIEIHFKEIKYRIIYISLSFLLTFFCGYLNITNIIYMLTLPFLKLKKLNLISNQTDFIFTNIFEAFSSYIFLSLIITVYLLLPIIIYSSFSFFKSGLIKHEKIYIAFIIKLFLVCSILSIIFTHKAFLPLILKFFLSFEELIKTNLFTLKLEPKILDYLYMIINFNLGFTIIFQIPLILFLLLNQNFINLKFLEKNRKFFLITFIIVGGLFSPPDLYAQLLIAVPLSSFFEFILFFSYIKNHYKKRRLLETVRG